MDASFSEVYRDHLAYVWHTLRRLGVEGRHLEDVAHDVFVVVHRQLGGYDPARPIKPWLFGIAFRVASDHRRRASTRREVLVEPEPEDHAPAPDALLEREQRRRLVHRALDRMPHDLRIAFVLFEIEGKTAPEIAELVSAPLNTIYSRVRLARARFERAVKELPGD